VSAKTAEDLIVAARAIAPGAVFSEPWEARAFAVAVALCEGGHFRWAEFQQSLIDEIAAAEKAGHATSGGVDYYRHWLDALARLLNDKRIIGLAELQARVAIAGPPPAPQDPHKQDMHKQDPHGQDPHK
jgi:nitrile hydratase accessory protein